ncbi:hypothetical protein Kpho02_77040 [Kitasatospora phosalacinea]|uniref:TniQ domain-containing protein n=1 Tax=Kitasatospora phosalacinea TaxID=2065 RepID=A0A9W6V7M5_9ACTN|nr:TniQ family protein [Kitasatospora phosalacinea]GLW75407.1 hypothetical protein Kpho02_77040 [Kitasatospora phosalacinea]
MTSRPLLLSLDPLDDETLSGYLIRLAHRHHVDPIRMLRRTGLAASDAKIVRIPVRLALELDTERAEHFGRATRLDPAEVSGLLMAPISTRYGPLATTRTAAAADGPWAFTENIRYCPDCLAGDGSEIQNLHGGTWRRTWRLPVAFTCPHHRRLLRDSCPDCGSPVQAGGPNSLIGRPNDDGLHPTQCRGSLESAGKTRSVRPACGADLTQAESNDFRRLSPQTRQALSSAQEHIQSLLDHDGPTTVGSIGWEVPTAQYFTDLRAVTALIFMSWPEARPLVATPTLAQAIDPEADRRHTAFSRLRAARGSLAGRAYSDPPTDPLVAGAVFELAARLLSSPDEVAAAAVLEPLAEEARYRHQSVSYNIRRAPGTSLPLQAVLLRPARRAPDTATTTQRLERVPGLTRV